MARSVIAIILLTITIGLLSSFISSPDFFTQSGAILFAVLLIALLYALPNLVILLALHYSKFVKRSVMSIRFIILEVCVLFLAVWVVDLLIDTVGESERFEVTPTLTRVKPYYSEGAQIIYSFFLTLLIIIPMARFTKLFEVSESAA